MDFGNPYKFRYVIYILAFICSLLNCVNSEISSPKEINEVVGHEVKILLNSTNNNSLSAVKFGLDGGKDYPLPKFLTAYLIGGNLTVSCSDELNDTAKSYRNRTYFIGNLTVGHAWFKITNLKLNDTNYYMVKIRKESEYSFRHTKRIKLTVHLPEFTNFEGIAEKRWNENTKVGSVFRTVVRRDVKRVIKRAYSNISMKVYVKYTRFDRKRKQVMVVRFHISFIKAVNQTFAFSFLRVAQRNKELGGYNITCFNYTHNSPPKSKKGNVPTDNSDKSALWVSLAILGVVILVLIIIFVKYFNCSCERVIGWFVSLMKRRCSEHEVGANTG